MAARLLPAHVVSLLCADVPELTSDVEDAVRLVDMDVYLGFPLGARENQRVAEFAERLAQLAPVDIDSRHDALGAEAVPGLQRSARGNDGCFDAQQRQVGFGDDVARTDVLIHAVDEVDESLGAGIHDAGFAQHLQLFLGCRERQSRLLECILEKCGEIAVRALSAPVVDARGERGDDRENGALARVRHRVVGVVAAHGDCLREGVRREPAEVAGRVAHALEELRHNCARIASRAIQQCVGDCRQQGPQVFFVGLLQDRQRSAQGQAQVRSGIAVRHREYVDLVEYFLVVDNAMNA